MILSNRSLQFQECYQGCQAPMRNVRVLDYHFGSQMIVLFLLAVLVGSMFAQEAFDRLPAEEDHTDRN